jgi:hypothetical protein
MLASEAICSGACAIMHTAALSMEGLYCYTVDLRIVGPLLRTSLDAWRTLENDWLARQQLLVFGLGVVFIVLTAQWAATFTAYQSPMCFPAHSEPRLNRANLHGQANFRREVEIVELTMQEWRARVFPHRFAA